MAETGGSGSEPGRGGSGRNRVDPPPAALARNTGFLMSKVSQLAREGFERALGPMGLKARHYGVLTALAGEGPHAQGDLGERLAIDRTTMVGLVDELEGLGLVERRRDREDRRRYDLVLTDAGKRTISEAEAVAARVQEAVLSPLDEAERRRLHGMLARVLRNLDEDAGFWEAGR